MKEPAIKVPEACKEVLLHACCAPCSSAIVEWLLQHDIRPTIFYYNPNIFPREEYEIRKNESKRHAESLGLTWIDGDYDHAQWQQDVCGLEGEPERGRRCELCFTLRLIATAKKAQALGIPYFTTTLASSRWKNLEQINRAGFIAQESLKSERNLSPQPSSLSLQQSYLSPLTSHLSPQPSPSSLSPQQIPEQSSPTRSLSYLSPLTSHLSPLKHTSHLLPLFWPQNWRKGGLYERRNQLLKEFNFYNQQYCGCEFSQRSK